MGNDGEKRGKKCKLHQFYNSNNIHTISVVQKFKKFPRNDTTGYIRFLDSARNDVISGVLTGKEKAGQGGKASTPRD